MIIPASDSDSDLSSGSELRAARFGATTRIRSEIYKSDLGNSTTTSPVAVVVVAAVVVDDDDCMLLIIHLIFETTGEKRNVFLLSSTTSTRAARADELKTSPPIEAGETQTNCFVKVAPRWKYRRRTDRREISAAGNIIKINPIPRDQVRPGEFRSFAERRRVFFLASARQSAPPRECSVSPLLALNQKREASGGRNFGFGQQIGPSIGSPISSRERSGSARRRMESAQRGRTSLDKSILI